MVDLALPSGPSGMDPSQTSFFQALNIGTKIVKGQIELVSEFPILKNGEKVSPSAAVLLGKLGIKPFEYGIEVQQVYQDASVFDAAVLDIKDSVLISKFLNGVANMAAFSREIGVPTEAGVPHMFGNAFRNIAALVSDIDFTFKEVEPVKAFLDDPEAHAAVFFHHFNLIAAESDLVTLESCLTSDNKQLLIQGLILVLLVLHVGLEGLVVSIDLWVDLILYILYLCHQVVHHRVDISAENPHISLIEGQQFVPEDHLLLDSFDVVVHCVVRFVRDRCRRAGLGRESVVPQNGNPWAVSLLQSSLTVHVLRSCGKSGPGELVN